MSKQQQEQERKMLQDALSQQESRSEFLRDYFSMNDNPVQFDPRDAFGRRLSGWKAGDTILSVTWKKSCYIFRKALDPDSYDISTMRDLKKKAQLYDTYIFVSLFVISFPLTVFVPYVLPRLQRVKREYFMHQYEKRKMIQDILGVKTQKLSLHELKRILRKQDK